MIKINNWSSHQSYKDRKPPWIRLHKTMLDDYDFHMMSVSARALLPMLWLLASEDADPTSGKIQSDYKKIAFRLRCTEKEITQAVRECAENGFLQVIDKQPCIESVTKPYKDSLVSVTPETETETETETDKKEDKPELVSAQTWLDFKQLRKSKKAPITKTVLKLITKQAEQAGFTLEEALQECCSRGWTAFKADWIKDKFGKPIVKQKERTDLLPLPKLGE